VNIRGLSINERKSSLPSDLYPLGAGAKDDHTATTVKPEMIEITVAAQKSTLSTSKAFLETGKCIGVGNEHLATWPILYKQGVPLAHIHMSRAR